MIHTGDCIEVMRGMEADSVDAVMTDPPYALTFMGKEWDKFGDRRQAGDATFHKSGAGPFDRATVRHGLYANARPALLAFQAWCEAWGIEALRVTKPGGWLVAAGGTRTHHRLVCGLEDAGWEIRDELHHIFASGFPKSLNVSAALRKLPACACDVPSEFGAVDPGLPAGTVGARVGAEPGSVSLAGSTTDQTSGVGAKPGLRARGRRGQMDSGSMEFGWERDPVVLGAPGMAGTAQGDEVVEPVGRIEADPEPLRDDVMDDQAPDGSAIDAPAIPLEDRISDDTPSSAFVGPLPSTPGGIVVTGDASAVIDGHAGTGAVDGLGSGPLDDLATGPTGEGVGHPPDYTAEDRALICETCGGIRQDRIPEGMGTALKPAHEPWVLARKPLVGNVAANVARYGTGALGIDECRIEGAWAYPNGPGTGGFTTEKFMGQVGKGEKTNPYLGQAVESHPAGRWPSNVLLSDPALFDEPNPYVVGSGATATSGARAPSEERDDTENWRMLTQGNEADSGGYSRFFRVPDYEQRAGHRPTGDEEVAAVPQGGQRVTGTGGDYPKAFLIPKSSRADREPVVRGQLEHRSAGVTGRRSVEPGEYEEFVHPAPEGIGAWLKGQREEAGLQQKQVAAHFPSKTGGLTGCVANWELEFNRPTADQWRKLSEVIGFDDRYDEIMTTIHSVERELFDDREPPKRQNAHPTVKPVDLMRHLIRLVTPSGGTVLDPFLGSGSTAIACELEGFPWIGIEKEPEYVAIAEARLNGTQRGLGLDVAAPTNTRKGRARPDSQIPEWPATWKDENDPAGTFTRGVRRAHKKEPAA